MNKKKTFFTVLVIAVVAVGFIFSLVSHKEKEMMIQEWYGALYKKDEIAYLGWTCDPEVTYILEYTPSKMPDSEIIKMAESAESVEGKCATIVRKTSSRRGI